MPKNATRRRAITPRISKLANSTCAICAASDASSSFVRNSERYSKPSGTSASNSEPGVGSTRIHKYCSARRVRESECDLQLEPRRPRQRRVRMNVFDAGDRLTLQPRAVEVVDVGHVRIEDVEQLKDQPGSPRQ